LKKLKEYRNIVNSELQKQISDYQSLSFPSPICKNQLVFLDSDMENIQNKELRELANKSFDRFDKVYKALS
jgi:hypothetical protein